jgi:hypothetical protein
MVIGMRPKGPGGDLPCKAGSATDDREPARWRADRAEFLGEDGVGREYWLVGGRVYAEGDGRAYPVCPLASWGRDRKLRAIHGRAVGRTLAA